MPPLSGSGKPPYGAKHLAVAPTLLTTSRAELITCGGGWRPAARAASTSEVISGHAKGLNANTQKKNKKGTKKRRKTSEGRHGGYRRISLVYTLVSGGGGRGGRRGRSSWPRPLPAQRPLVDPGLPTCLTFSSSSPPFTPLSCSRLLLSYSSASLSHHFLFLSLFSSNQQQQQIITLFIQVFFDRHGNTELNVHKSHKVTKTEQITREKQQK